MKQPIVKGHPLHAIMTDLPVAGIVLSYGFDVLSLVAKDQKLCSQVATANLAAAFAGGVVAGGVGWWDFFNIPADHPSRAPALTHGAVNVGLLALTGVNLALRARQPSHRRGTATAPLLLSTLGVAALSVSGWLGGNLVFAFGWRVRPAEQFELLEAQLEREGRHQDVERAAQEVAQFERQSALIP